MKAALAFLVMFTLGGLAFAQSIGDVKNFYLSNQAGIDLLAKEHPNEAAKLQTIARNILSRMRSDETSQSSSDSLLSRHLDIGMVAQYGAGILVDELMEMKKQIRFSIIFSIGLNGPRESKDELVYKTITNSLLATMGIN